MSLTPPIDLKDLALQLIGMRFNRVTPIAELLGVDSAKDFFNLIPEADICIGQEFVRSIPIVYEVVSVKKYDYTLLTHVVYWLADGEPYIYTPTPTIGHMRHGMQFKKLERGEQINVPNNVNRFDVLAINQRCEHDEPFDPRATINMKFTRYER